MSKHPANSTRYSFPLSRCAGNTFLIVVLPLALFVLSFFHLSSILIDNFDSQSSFEPITSDIDQLTITDDLGDSDFAIGAGKRSCRDIKPLPPRNVKTNPWRPLSIHEAQSVKDFLFKYQGVILNPYHADDDLPTARVHAFDDEGRKNGKGMNRLDRERQVGSKRGGGFNLTRGDVATDEDNAIWNIELWAPIKGKEWKVKGRDEDVKDWNENEESVVGVKGGERWARVIIHHGAESPPYVAEWLVGPLPVSSKTRVEAQTNVYHRTPIPYSSRLPTPSSWSILSDYMTDLLTSWPENILVDLIGLKVQDVVGMATTPMSWNGDWRRTWVQVCWNTSGAFLHPLDMYLELDLLSLKREDWKVRKVVYNKQIFRSQEEFVEAYERKEIKKGSIEHFNASNTWATRERRGPDRDLDDRPGPRSVSFGGQRFRVHEEERWVSWMGWEFYLGHNRDMGVSLWDIKFLNERIIYELSPQEALAQYSGGDPHQASTVWLDSAFGMGACLLELLKGYDCPYDAVYLPVEVHTIMGSTRRENAICVFEMDEGKPIHRHTGWGRNEMGATKGYKLVVRSVASVGNYDYIFDYSFYLDGTIQVEVSASGYLQGGYWASDGSQEAYGSRIGPFSMGTLHDHVINFKVDFDIAGTQNSLQELKLEMEAVDQPWFDGEDDWGPVVEQVKTVKRWLNSEDEGLLKWHKNGEGFYLIANKEVSNKWGHPRAYAIHPGASTIHQANVNSKRAWKSVNWAKQNLAVSTRKESERYASCSWNINLPGAPAIDFDNFFDGESFNQTDLVAWINIGTHHIPRAEDSPMTLTTLAHTSFLLTPFNYFSEDVSMSSKNSILLNVPKQSKSKWEYEDNGVNDWDDQNLCVPEKIEKFKYTGIVRYDDSGLPMATDQEEQTWHLVKLKVPGEL